MGSAAASHGRRQLSEEFVTYKLMDLIDDFAAAGYPIWIQDFGRIEEASHGADIELWFWDRSAHLATGWLVQAKRLSAPRTTPSAPRFEAIDHKVGGKAQVDLLVAAASAEPGLTPIYWLYSWDFPRPTRCVGPGQPCRCTPSGLDDALLVAPATVIAGTSGKTWHSVVMKNRDSLDSLRRIWCHASGSVSTLAAATAALRSAPAVGQSDQRPLTVERPPLYVLDSFGLRNADDREDDSGRTSARRLALFAI